MFLPSDYIGPANGMNQTGGNLVMQNRECHYFNFLVTDKKNSGKEFPESLLLLSIPLIFNSQTSIRIN